MLNMFNINMALNLAVKIFQLLCETHHHCSKSSSKRVLTLNYDRAKPQTRVKHIIMSATDWAGITRKKVEKTTEKSIPRPPQSQLSGAHHENTQQSPSRRARLAVEPIFTVTATSANNSGVSSVLSSSPRAHKSWHWRMASVGTGPSCH